MVRCSILYVCVAGCQAAGGDNVSVYNLFPALLCLFHRPHLLPHVCVSAMTSWRWLRGLATSTRNWTLSSTRSATPTFAPLLNVASRQGVRLGIAVRRKAYMPWHFGTGNSAWDEIPRLSNIRSRTAIRPRDECPLGLIDWVPLYEFP